MSCDCGLGADGGLLDCSNEIRGSTLCEKIVGKLRIYSLLKKDSAP
jgi:hypothetical protein